jgi:hypothetical protein
MQSVTVPIKVVIVLPPLASILVKFASTLQIAPFFKVMIALLVPELLLKVTVAPILVWLQVNCVLILY